MIELVLVCLLGMKELDVSKIAPWELTKIETEAKGGPNYWLENSIVLTYEKSCAACETTTTLHLRRKVNSGDKIQIPEWCKDARQTMVAR